MTARCVICDGPLDGRRPQTRTCSPACRQKDYRRRQAQERETRPIVAAAVALGDGRTLASVTSSARAVCPSVRESDVESWLREWLLDGIVEDAGGAWRLTPEWARDLAGFGDPRTREYINTKGASE